MTENIKNLESTVAELRSLKTLREELEAEIKALENSVIDFMTETGESKHIGSDFTITYTDCTRKTLDRKALETAFGSLTEYEKISAYKRLTIK